MQYARAQIELWALSVLGLSVPKNNFDDFRRNTAIKFCIRKDSIMGKILFCASTISHIRNFHLPYMKILREKGYEVWVAANREESIPYANRVVAFPFKKSLFSFHNIIAVFELRKFLIKERFDKISANTALASVVIRLAVLLIPKAMRPQVYYIVHGFLFHENDGLGKWIYLLPEILCAPVTNVLMVMNQEDLGIARRYHLYRENLSFINGIGINLSQFHSLSSEDRAQNRQVHGFSDEDYLFIYAAEFSKRKSHEFLIRAFAKVSPEFPQAHLLLAGDGILLEKCAALAKKLNVEDKIHFLGYVEKMRDLYPLCDAAVSSSKIEGLPFNIMEAMACGLPVLISDIKGHRDLVGEKKEFLFRTEQELSDKMSKFILQPRRRFDWSPVLAKYSIEQVAPKVIELYGL